jgi:hypothetical protein
MNFNYRDFFIHNDDLHIIKEELSIVDEVKVATKNALIPNAKAVWAAYTSGSNEEKIAKDLKINVETVEKIIYICLMKATDNKITPKQIGAELKMRPITIQFILSKALGPSWIRGNDSHIIDNAVKIYDLHNKEKSPEEIKNSINKDKPKHLEEITVDKVNLVLKIIDIAKIQTDSAGMVNANKIHKEIDGKISYPTVVKLIKTLDLAEIRYTHKFTQEQDAFILFNYLQGINQSKTAEKFNLNFSTESNILNMFPGTIRARLIRMLNHKDKGESEISKKVLELLGGIYKDKYFSTVNIEKLDDKTKNLLTHYTPAKTVGSRDRLARRGGQVDPTRQISGQTGNLDRNIHQTITTGQIPASGQLGKKYGAPINTQGALAL